MDLEQYEELIWSHLKSALKDLLRRVDLICIACHTLHYFCDRIRLLGLSAEFVSAVCVAHDYVKKNEIRKLAILGTRSTAELGKWFPYALLQDYVEIKKPRDLLGVHFKDCSFGSHGITDGTIGCSRY